VRGTVAFVLKGYPRVSETFIAQEIRSLEQRGLDILIVSLRRPTDRVRHPVHDEVRAPVHYLPEYLHEVPLRVWRAWRAVRTWPRYREAYRIFIRDFWRDPTRNRIRRFGQALVMAHELPKGVRHLHAHFLHTPASVTRYAAALTGLPWTCSAHAKDIWMTPSWETREKLASAQWTLTCTKFGCEYLRSLTPAPAQVTLAYHGLDAARFPPPPRRQPDGADRPVMILSVGRAVRKKGFDDLLLALSKIPKSADWRFRHVGGGPLLKSLKRDAGRLGLDGRIEWLGPRAQAEVLACYREADIFVLPSRIAPDGDRDGLPNVLMEAQSQGLPCVSTDVAGIPELIITGETGLMVAPGDVDALSAALLGLIRDRSERARLGHAGQMRVRGQFSHDAGIDHIATMFGLEETACASHSMRR
jgi:glycosyltransferase involved in cell wall biosynthesis